MKDLTRRSFDRITAVFGIALLSIHFGQVAAEEPPSREQVEFFEKSIRPVLVEQCLGCHGPKKSEAGLRLDRLDRILQGGESGPALVPGNVDASLLMQAIRHSDSLQMPPDKKLESFQLRDFERWIQGGAAWPVGAKLGGDGPELRSGTITPQEKAFWSLQPLSQLALDPSASDRSASIPSNAEMSREIDRLVDEKLSQHQLRRRGPADKRTLLRRATYDLTGLPPTESEVDAFMQDRSEDAFAKAVEGLLNSKAYGERWGRHWLDVVHYADTAGETADYPTPLAYKYRNWVIDAFNRDMPYDRFLQEQIAGDLMASREKASEAETEKMRIATGLIAISRRFGFDVENYHNLTIQDTIDTLGQSVLGLSLGCARCHDHKFDPVNMEDYYAWYGIFESTRYSFPGSEEKKRPYDLFPPVSKEVAAERQKSFDQQVVDLESRIKELDQRREQTEEEMSDVLGFDSYVGFELDQVGSSPAAPYNFLGKALIQQDAQSPFQNAFLPGTRGIAFPSSADNDAFGRPFQVAHTLKTSPQLYYNIDFRNRSIDSAGVGAYRFYVGHGPGNSGAMELAASASTFYAKNGGAYQPVCNLELGRWYNVQASLDLKSQTYDLTITSFSEPSGLNRDSLQTNQTNKESLEESTSIEHFAFTSGWDGIIDYTFVDKFGPIDGVHPAHDIDNLSIRTSPHLEAKDQVGAKPIPKAHARWQHWIESNRLKNGSANRENHPGLMAWHADSSLPLVAINTSAETLKIPGTVEPGKLVVHPQERDGVAIGWRSPIQGRIKITGGVASVHSCGDSILWHIDRLGGAGLRAIASGSIEKDGRGEFSTNEIPAGPAPASAESPTLSDCLVEFGDVLQLTILPKANHGCDLTEVHWTLEELSSGKKWDLVNDCKADLLESNPHRDSQGHPACWFFYQVPPDRGTALSSKIEAKNKRIGLPNPSNQDFVNQDWAAQKQKWEEELAKLNELKTLLDRLKKSGPFEPSSLIYGAIDQDQAKDAAIQLRGEKSKLGAIAVRRNLEILGKTPLQSTSSSGRWDLAMWLTDPANPLTPRVMANRIWQQHFGKGLVSTENDFGTRGSPPSHPELLDKLAIHFIQHGWSIKAMHRAIMNTASYQQGSDFDAQAAEVDPDAKWLWRFQPRRLSAEEIRDSMLAISGLLDPTMGTEHPFPPVDSWGFTQHGPFYGVYPTNRRSIYLMQQRLKRHPFLSLFDGADPNASTARRELTTVPTQALFLMNSEFVHAQAKNLALQLAQERDTEKRVQWLYRKVFQRQPMRDESTRALAFIQEYARSAEGASDQQTWEALARTMLVRNEFLFVH